MYDYSKNHSKRNTPYTAPTVVVYENKKFKYDEVGKIKAIVDIETETQKDERLLKKKLLKIFLIAYLIAVFIDLFIRFWNYCVI